MFLNDNQQMKEYPNIMLLSGTARNVGKTTFVCKILSHFEQHRIITVKVSPHWHEVKQGNILIHDPASLMLVRETVTDSYKDTSRMLRCGAHKVYYLQYTSDEALLKGFHYLMTGRKSSEPMIIETAILGKYISPALHFRITRIDAEPSTKKVIDVPIDELIHFDGRDFDLSPSSIQWEPNKWIYKKGPVSGV